MNPSIETLPAKKLVGMRMSMSIANNKTGELWRGFMPRRKEIGNAIGTDLFSMQLYDPDHFENFDPNREFVKWAAMEVTDYKDVPAGMETIDLPAGLYAVFHYKGDATLAAPFFQYIFTNWLPNSGYVLDHRPHFEILGESYKNNDPSSEEDIWVPVRRKD